MSATGPAADAARLKVELWAARDAAIGAEAAAGQLRGRVKELESTLDDRDRHIEALLARMASLQERLDASEAQRDAVLKLRGLAPRSAGGAPPGSCSAGPPAAPRERALACRSSRRCSTRRWRRCGSASPRCWPRPTSAWELCLVDDASTDARRGRRPGRAAAERSPDPGAHAARRTAASWRRPTTAWRWRRPSSSGSSTTTICWRRTRVASRCSPPSTPTRRSTSSTATRTTSASTAARSIPSSSRTGRPSASGRACTRTTSPSSAGRWRCEVGGFRAGYEGAQDYDLVLRVTERTDRVRPHPRDPLPLAGRGRRPRRPTPRPSRGPSTPASGPCRTIASAPASTPRSRRLPIAGLHRLRRRVAGAPTVSVVIPTRGSSGRVWGVERTFVVEAVRNVVERAASAPRRDRRRGRRRDARRRPGGDQPRAAATS